MRLTHRITHACDQKEETRLHVQGWICGRRIFIVDNDAKKSNG
nr:MAG TPA: hypothetical protein [Caudoviricetes sp.]